MFVADLSRGVLVIILVAGSKNVVEGMAMDNSGNRGLHGLCNGVC